MCSLALVGCCVTCPQGDENKCLLTLERVLTIDQSQDTAKANSLTQRAFLGLLAGIWVKGYSQEQKRFKDICITKAHPCVGDSSGKLGNLGHTAQPAAVWQIGEHLSHLTIPNLNQVPSRVARINSGSFQAHGILLSS